MSSIIKKTRRLIIRPLEASDYKTWKEAQISKMPKQNIWDSNIRENNRINSSEFKKILKNQKLQRNNDEYHDFAVFIKKSGELIGRVSAMNVIRSVTQSSYLGYFINNDHWGKGYGTEAVRGFVDIAFNDLKLHRLEAGIEPTNKRSIRLIKAVGFRKEGLKKRIIYLRENWQDAVIYSATCEDFKIKWKGNVDLKTRLRL